MNWSKTIIQTVWYSLKPSVLYIREELQGNAITINVIVSRLAYLNYAIIIFFRSYKFH